MEFVARPQADVCGRVSGQGAGQVRMSSTQVPAIPAAPISGITAIGLPRPGTIRYQGRVGLAQNWVRKPEK